MSGIFIFIIVFLLSLTCVQHLLTCMFMFVVNAVTNVITWLASITGNVLYWCVFATISFTALIFLPPGLSVFGSPFVWVCSKGVGASVPTSTLPARMGIVSPCPHAKTMYLIGGQ